MHISTLASCLSLLVASTSGHMQMSLPPPLRSKFNPYSGPLVDYSMTNPLRKDGSDFPCKGYHLQLYSPLGAPMVKLQGGKTYVMTFTGEASHDGGSCQISLSIDGGNTFYVLHSYIGNCPAMPGDNTLDFRVPINIPRVSRALFAWTWFNKLGNREMYMNCASVTTEPGEGDGDSLLSRPRLFAANVGNGCVTQESKDVMFPDPGPELTVKNPGAALPIGECGLPKGGGPARKEKSWFGPWIPANRTEGRKTEEYPVTPTSGSFVLGQLN